MTVPPAKHILRWALVPIAAGAAACAGILLLAGALIVSGGLMVNWSGTVMLGILTAEMAFLAVVAGAFTAPAARLRVGLVIWLASIFWAYGTYVSDIGEGPETDFGAVLGGGLACGWIHLRERFQDRPALRARWAGGAVALLLAAAATYGVICYYDFFARPSMPTRGMHRPYFDTSLRRSAEVRSSFHTYRLGEDSGNLALFRFRASREQVDVLAGELGLQPKDSLPAQFWAMPPYWWPRQAPANVVMFGTPAFPLNGDSPHGEYFLLAYNPGDSLGYIWMKGFY